jgi:hypothetical protein
LFLTGFCLRKKDRITIMAKPMTMVAIPPRDRVATLVRTPARQGGDASEDPRPKGGPVDQGALIEQLFTVLHKDSEDNKIHHILEGSKRVLMGKRALRGKYPAGNGVRFRS